MVLALVATASTAYVGFVIPCLLIGAGFVVATTVRTAIIFASVPDGLPATAAALNESSIAVGSRIGTVVVTALVAQVALSTYAASVVGQPAAAAADAVAAFRSVLLAVGTPSFSDVAATIGSADIRPYLDAYTAGLNYAFFACGVVGVIGGLIALLAFGQQDPLKTRWDNRDERALAGTTIVS